MEKDFRELTLENVFVLSFLNLFGMAVLWGMGAPWPHLVLPGFLLLNFSLPKEMVARHYMFWIINIVMLAVMLFTGVWWLWIVMYYVIVFVAEGNG